ncbi:hypothetical protein IFM89_031789 [Coptis chinensis]|uniref:Retrotransposon Copia-like N-terminal domain-containing protein n=1 Tax=Coptis chinensis TaxID=261450 RepID=A0A835MJT4_9MAGN|nr:hypothetical protein IFM89_031789 [Coptis chinensis]
MDDISDTGKNSSVVIGEWSEAVNVFLHAKMKQKYLTDDPPDENSPSAETWWSEMPMVMTWLWHSMEPSVASTVQFLDTAKKIWNAIEEMYSQTSNVSQIYQIFKSMFSTKQDASTAFVSNGHGGSVRGGRGPGGCSSAPRGAHGGTHGGRGGHGPRPDWLCDYCGNIGHTEPFCYKKNGYPPSVHHTSEEPSSNNPQFASTQDDVFS